MSTEPVQPASAQQPLPAAQVPPAPPPSRGGFPVMGCLFGVSFVVNLLLGVLLLVACMGLLFRGNQDATSTTVTEKHHSGNKTSKDKVAIITLDGPILDGAHGQLEREIEQAAEDDHVKAVVFRVNSPGGSVTASDDIYRRLVALRDGDKDKKRDPKPLIVSMGAVAASGGYYVAAPGQYIFVEPTTVTGSIGVYASFPSLKGVKDRYGIDFKTIQAGELKGIPALFRDMEPREQRVIQDMVDASYVRFMEVIESSPRKNKLTKKKMLERFDVDPINPDPKADTRGRVPPEKYRRYIADGAIFMADLAVKKHLVDQIGSLDDAAAYCARQANLTDYKVVKYKKLPFLAEWLLNSKAAETQKPVLEQLGPIMEPRVWYLTPGYEASVRLAGARR